MAIPTVLLLASAKAFVYRSLTQDEACLSFRSFLKRIARLTNLQNQEVAEELLTVRDKILMRVAYRRHKDK